MNPLILTAIPGIVETALKVYMKVKEVRDATPPGQEPTPEQVKAIFDSFPVKTYDDYLNEARERAERGQTTLDL